MRGFSYRAVDIPLSFNLALQKCDSKAKLLAALNKVVWIRLLLNEQITLRRARLQVPLQAAVLPNGIQNLRSFRLHNRTADANPDFAAPERPVPKQAVSRRRQRPPFFQYFAQLPDQRLLPCGLCQLPLGPTGIRILDRCG
jgi:hypothetical protein